MSISFPFPTSLYRAIGEEPITVVAHDSDGAPSVVCVFADSAFERAVALVLLENRPDSFVVSHGRRYAPDGRVEAYDPARPWYAGELPLLFEVEWVELGPQPRISVFAHTEQEWKTARQAMKHLLHLGRLSPRSYLEGDHAGFDQGLSAHNLDGKPHGPQLVAQFREAAMCLQNETEGWDVEPDPLFVRVMAARARREGRVSEEEDWEDGEEGAFSGERWSGIRDDDEEDGWLEEEERSDEGKCEESLQEISVPAPWRITPALARWRQGSTIVKRLLFRDTGRFSCIYKKGR